MASTKLPSPRARNKSPKVGATTVALHLDYGSAGLEIRVADDGRGFEPERCPGSSEGHFGLTGMRERAKRIGGELTLRTAPGQGTSLEIAVPAAAADLAEPTAQTPGTT